MSNSRVGAIPDVAAAAADDLAMPFECRAAADVAHGKRVGPRGCLRRLLRDQILDHPRSGNGNGGQKAAAPRGRLQQMEESGLGSA